MSENVNFVETAKAYHNQGLPVVPLKGKQPLTDWAKWQNQPQTQEEYESLPWNKADGFAVICGIKNKDGLFIGTVDFDVKNLPSEVAEKGREVLKHLPTTQIEETPSGGQHWIYLSQQKPKTISVYHNICGLELIGEGKLCIMAPSRGYKRLNDNPPTVISGSLESAFFEALQKAGIAAKEKEAYWFGREDLKEGSYRGKDPPCILKLRRGTDEGSRNECGIRLASYLANFRGIPPKKVLRSLEFWNKLNRPPLEHKELEAILKSALQGGYVYGCSDVILQQNCDRENCPLTSTRKVLTEQEKQRALKILERPDILDLVVKFGRNQLIGEDNVLLINFLEICSGQTKYPISGIVEGFSGSGKNRSIEAVKPLIPEEWLYEFTTSTPEAVKYIPEEFSGTLIIYEAAGVQSKTGTLSLRAVGEGKNIETIYPVRDEATGVIKLHRAKTNAKNFVTTESSVDINEDLERRVFKVSMNHSTFLTRRVLAKKIRDSQYPESLKKLLGMDEDNSFNVEDFKNALRVNEWDREVVVFAPFHLLDLLCLAQSKEQEVALRTHVERILNFIKVLALLRQRQRTRIDAGDVKLVIASPQDVADAFAILSQTIITTVTRLTKRLQEALEVVKESVEPVTKHDIAEKLKVSEVTAARLLKALHKHGYLKEEKEKGNTPYKYTLVKTPELLVNLQNTSEYYLFFRKQKENLLKQTLSVCQFRGIRVNVYNVEESKSKPLTFSAFSVSAPTYTQNRQSEKVYLTSFPSFSAEKNPDLLVSSEMTSKTKPENTISYRRIKPAEPCEQCGERAVEYELRTRDGNVLRKCERCFEKLRQKFKSMIFVEFFDNNLQIDCRRRGYSFEAQKPEAPIQG